MDSSAELTEFARRVNIPVASTLMGLGNYPESDPIYYGMLGMHGTVAANYAVDQADLLLVRREYLHGRACCPPPSLPGGVAGAARAIRATGDGRPKDLKGRVSEARRFRCSAPRGQGRAELPGLPGSDFQSQQSL